MIIVGARRSETKMRFGQGHDTTVNLPVTGYRVRIRDTKLHFQGFEFFPSTHRVHLFDAVKENNVRERLRIRLLGAFLNTRTARRSNEPLTCSGIFITYCSS